jgi:CHAT domain-containing protein/Tfp pilus assembly protein PilF
MRSPAGCRRLAAAALLVAAGCGVRPPAEEVREWPVRGGVRAGIAAGEEHRWRLRLPAGHLVCLVVVQHGADVAVSLHGPGGGRLVAADRPTSEHGPELVLAVTAEGGDHVLTVREGLGAAGRYTAHLTALRRATEADRATAEAYRDFTEAARLQHGDAAKLPRLAQAVAAFHRLGLPQLEGEARFRRAQVHYAGRDYAPAASEYRAAADLFAEHGGAVWTAAARSSLGTVLLDLGETEAAATQLESALRLARPLGRSFTTARTLEALGVARRRQGELQQALDAWEEALASWPATASVSALTLHNLGVLHARFLGDAERGRQLLVDALEGWQAIEAPAWEATTLDQLGMLELEAGRPAAALEHFEAALELRDDGCARARTLARLALARAEAAESASERSPGPLLDQAFAAVEAGDCAVSRPTVHETAGRSWEVAGEPEHALAAFHRCDDLFAGQGDRVGRIECLAGVARTRRALGRPAAALEASGIALELVEGARPRVLRDDLRRSLFAARQDLYDLHVEMLLAEGSAEEAWLTAERARARTLRDLLAEAGGEARGAGAAGGTADLDARERALQRRLNETELRRRRAAEADPAEGERLAREVDALIDELERLRGERRRRDPAAAAGEPSLAELRRQLDGGALLLEFRLGREASTLWAVDRESLTAVRLPPRAEIEAVALEAAHWQRAVRWPRRTPRPLCELSEMLLGPVADRLAERPLILVPDGALETVSFAALPDPAAGCAAAPPLAARHDVSYLPSAAALAEQRRRLAGRVPAAGWLAVVADPVYGPSDPRAPVARGGSEGEPPSRLRFAEREAAAILARLPAERTFAARGLSASRRTVLSGALAGHRVVHFATHGVLHPDQPLWLSHLALARVDAAGRPVPGDLYAHEIYHLELPAELVVLSACDTAAGRYVRGEGLVAGLPRAFLHAGAARVVVSLWPVDDRSSRDLMVRFYDGVMRRGEPPARALREAQLALWRDGRPPRHWAPFVLQGDPRPLPPFLE